jgi:hypothetical protein
MGHTHMRLDPKNQSLYTKGLVLPIVQSVGLEFAKTRRAIFANGQTWGFFLQCGMGICIYQVYREIHISSGRESI